MAKPKATEIRDAVIDEAVVLNEKLLPFADDIKRLDLLKKKVRSWTEIDKLAAESSHLYVGTKGCIMLGPRENSRQFKPGALAAIFKLLGATKFLAACSFTLKAAAESVGEDKLAELVDEERTGSRPLTIAKAA